MSRPTARITLLSHEHAVAEQLLEEVSGLPLIPSDEERTRFRMRWAPWLWDRAPGPVDTWREPV